MDGKHPNRKKEKQNPYILSIEDGKEIILGVYGLRSNTMLPENASI